MGGSCPDVYHRGFPVYAHYTPERPESQHPFVETEEEKAPRRPQFGCGKRGDLKDSSGDGWNVRETDARDITDMSCREDIVTLTKHYGVTSDYLLELSENKNPESADLSDLHFRDAVMEILSGGKLNDHPI